MRDTRASGYKSVRKQGHKRTRVGDSKSAKAQGM